MTRRSTPRAMRRAVDQMEAAADYLPSAVVESALESTEDSAGDSPAATWGAGARRGRPVYDAEVVLKEICERHAAGELIGDILQNPRMPSDYTLIMWLRKYPDAAASYAVAREKHMALNPYRFTAGYSPGIADEICRAVEEGKTLAQIAADPALPCIAVLHQWRKKYPDFNAAYLAAREASAEACEHNAIREVERAYDRDSAAVAKVRSDVWRWAASVRNPRTHGTKVEATVNVEIGLADRLNAAIGRVSARVIEGVMVEGVAGGPDGGFAASGEAQEGGGGFSRV